MAHCMPFGCSLLSDTMEFLEVNQTIIAPLKLMNRFLKDNMHLHLLHLAESKPLIDVFGEVVSHHASHFDSLDVTGADPSQPVICSEPTSYTLTVLPDECM